MGLSRRARLRPTARGRVCILLRSEPTSTSAMPSRPRNKAATRSTSACSPRRRAQLMIDQRPGAAAGQIECSPSACLAPPEVRRAQRAVGIGDVIDGDDRVFAGHQPQRCAAQAVIAPATSSANTPSSSPSAASASGLSGPVFCGGVVEMRQIDIGEVGLRLRRAATTAESQIQAVDLMFDSGPQKCISGKWPSVSRSGRKLRSAWCSTTAIRSRRGCGSAPGVQIRSAPQPLLCSANQTAEVARRRAGAGCPRFAAAGCTRSRRSTSRLAACAPIEAVGHHAVFAGQFAGRHVGLHRTGDARKAGHEVRQVAAGRENARASAWPATSCLRKPGIESRTT